MAQSYYAQSEQPAATLTVGQLIERLKAFDPAELVIFKSPLHGVFGSNTAYTIDAIDKVLLPRREHHTAAGTEIDEESGKETLYEAYTQVFHAWSGVVIS